MNTTHDGLDRAARYAPDTVLDPEGLIAARAAVDRGIAEDAAGPSAASAPASAPAVAPLHRPRRRTLRWAIPAAAAVCGLAVAGGLALRNAPEAQAQPYAGWTQVPQATSPADRAKAAASCRAALTGTSNSDRAVSDAAIAAMEPLIVDVRGPWQYVVLGNGDGRKGMCLNGSAFTDSRTDPTDEWLGDPNEFAGHVAFVSMSLRLGPEGRIAVTEGRVADDVVGVSLLVEGQAPVGATVQNGRFVLWSPSKEGRPDPGDLGSDDSVTVTYTDGAVKTYKVNDTGPADH